MTARSLLSVAIAVILLALAACHPSNPQRPIDTTMSASAPAMGGTSAPESNK
jgi:hypothetical protein